MRIDKKKYKVKVILEYVPKLLDFGSISKKDLDKLYLKVFLEDGGVIMGDEIKQITYAVKEEQLQKEIGGMK